MITYPAAPRVTPGQPLVSDQIAGLASAVNARLLSGPGNSAWRVGWMLYNLWRQPRLPDASGWLMPAQDEAFAFYHHINPDVTSAGWPDTGPGEPEGSNPASPVPQYVFGIPDTDLVPEAERTWPVPLWLTAEHGPITLEDHWRLGKLQRGVLDPEQGAQNVPALTAAQSFYRIVFPSWSPHHKEYGGKQPLPQVLIDDCLATDMSPIGIPSFAIKFTALRSDVSTDGLHGTITTNAEGNPVCTYAGSCPLDTHYTAAGHVIGMSSWPFGYLVAVNDGSGGVWVDWFPINDWIVGPYDGAPSLQREDSEMLGRAMWRFITDYRGTVLQRDPDTFDIRAIAAACQEFFTRAYALAPAKGRLDGQLIEELYPTFELVGSAGGVHASGTTLGAHQFSPGFVLAGAFAKASGLREPTSIAVRDSSGAAICTLALTPDANGDAEALVWLPAPANPGSVTAVLIERAWYLDHVPGSIHLELAELYEYQPNWWDLWLVLRLGAARPDQPIAGVGTRIEDAARITGDLFRYGCVVNGLADAVPADDIINHNPVADAARRLVRDNFRVINRHQFRSYEVLDDSGTTKSILRFRRYARGRTDIGLDMFGGLAPSIYPAETLEASVAYVVRGPEGSRIMFRGAAYHPGTVFTPSVAGEYTAEGGALVYEREGIIAAARPKRWTNEWVCWLETHVHHPSTTSVWSPDIYADYFTWCNRCLFQLGVGGSAAFRRFANFNHRVTSTITDDGERVLTLNPMTVQTDWLSPEAPDGYRMLDGANVYGSTPSANWFSSCQIYRAPYRVESVTVEFEADGTEIVVVQLDRRCDAHPDAPATWDADPPVWASNETMPAIVADHLTHYRTDDNALCDYHVHQANDHFQIPWRTGDAGWGSSIQSMPDNPYGSGYPHCFFLRLIPKPYEDGNEIAESTDARPIVDQLQQVEMYLRAMCGGYLDERTTLQLNNCELVTIGTVVSCDSDDLGLYDYTWTNLLYQAGEKRWISAFDASAREDGPAGFGPLPNTIFYAEVFNVLASAVDLLHRVRVPLPAQLEVKEDYYYDSRTLALEESNGCGEPGSCGGGGMTWYGAPPAPNTLDIAGTWTSGTSVAAVVVSQIADTCRSGEWVIESYAYRVGWRFALLHSDAINAIPSEWSDMLSTHITTLWCRQDTRITTVVASDPGTTDCGGIARFACAFDASVEDQASCQMLTASGSDAVLDAGGPLGGWHTIWNDGVPTHFCRSGSSHSITLTPLLGPLNDRLILAIPVV